MNFILGVGCNSNFDCLDSPYYQLSSLLALSGFLSARIELWCFPLILTKFSGFVAFWQGVGEMKCDPRTGLGVAWAG
jgi:hypothetical protein